MKNLSILLIALGLVLTNCKDHKKETTITLEALKQKDSLAVEKVAKEILERNNEADFSVLASYYRSKGNKAKRKEVTKLAISKFPNGQFAITEKVNSDWKEKSIAEKEDLIKNFEEEYPDYDFSRQYFDLAMRLLSDNKLNEAINYQSRMNKEESGRYLVASQISDYVLNDQGIDLTEFVTKEISNINQYYDDKNKQAILKQLRYNLSEALAEKGQLHAALVQIEQIFEEDPRSKKSGSLLMAYGSLLAKTKQYEKALPVLETTVVQGVATDQIKELLEASFNAVGKTNYKAFEEDLNRRLQDSTRAYLSKKIINKPSPNFPITDINGNVVNISDFKGKILILDYWATWCSPCKQSFPAMQAAVNKYKNDNSVKFLFIQTFERGKKAFAMGQDYLKENNYNFDAYMDYRNPETKKHEAASAFGIKAIPTKVIIDANGNVRFISTGGVLSVDRLLTEISIMIDMIQSTPQNS